jgi:uncharacterized glyoxalase superfamily protein PhnB
MVTINPYLNFAGNTEEAFNFYKSVFGGEFLMVVRFKDNPEGDRTPEADKDKIMHIALPIGKGNILMATDAIGQMGEKLVEGNNYYLSVNGEGLEETKKVFDALAAGGNVVYPFDKAPWGGYFGQLEDKFGIQWMTSCEDTAQQ